MVFCYKIITDSPGRSYNASPRRKCTSTTEKRQKESAANLLKVHIDDPKENYYKDILNSIPERDWRLLDALARKRHEDEKRLNMSRQLHKIWDQEKEVREQADAELYEQFQRFIHNKREQELYQQKTRMRQKMIEGKYREGLLEQAIREKEERSKELRAWINDEKLNYLIDKSLDHRARIYQAADRRLRQSAAEQYKHEAEAFDTLVRLNRARRKRKDILKEASKRIAINNAVNNWETGMNRQETIASEMAKRAEYAYHAAIIEQKRRNLERAKQAKLKQNRKIAEITRVLRDAIRSGYMPLK